jgi:hypothetical protein
VASTVGREVAFHWPVTQPLSVPLSEFMQRFGPTIQHFEASKELSFVPANQAQCRDEHCYFVMDGHSLYSDDSHIAAPELWRFSGLFEAVTLR